MAVGRKAALAVSVALATLTVSVLAQTGGAFPEEQVRIGAEIYSRNCAPCHGPRMMDSQVPVDLRNFPPGERARFLASVTNGKNQMPPWGGLFKAEEIEALWAYVIAGEKE
jgi:mono/diheme cytochrome c family protein